MLENVTNLSYLVGLIMCMNVEVRICVTVLNLSFCLDSGRTVGEICISLENILIFITGVDHIPPFQRYVLLEVFTAKR